MPLTVFERVTLMLNLTTEIKENKSNPKWQEETFRGNGYVYYYDDGSMDMCMFPNSSIVPI